jgi:hypothetical protein
MEQHNVSKPNVVFCKLKASTLSFHATAAYLNDINCSGNRKYCIIPEAYKKMKVVIPCSIT